jgi:hypothetical protein
MSGVLSSSDIEDFVERGFVRVDEAIPRQVAAQCRDLAYEQLDVPRAAPWAEPVQRGVAEGEPVRVAANSPRLIGAIGQLLKGEAWQPRPNLGLLVIRCPSEVDPGDGGWHIDGSFPGPDTDDLSSWYVNYESKGRGLLLLCLLSDVGVEDAPTRILEGSHHAVAELLAPLGERGVLAQAAPLPEVDDQIALATGRAGDVFLCHPFLVHAASWPHRGGKPRVIAQPPIALDGALRYDRPEHDCSPVARVLQRTSNH